MVMKSVKLASILFYLNSVLSFLVSCHAVLHNGSVLSFNRGYKRGMDKPGLLELGDEIKGLLLSL